MKKISPLILIVFALSAQMIFAQNAPISTVGNETSTGSTITVPIRATDFTDIGSCNMQLLFNPAIAVCTGVTMGPGLPGGIAFDFPSPGIVTFGWYTWPGVTLPDNSVIFNLTFSKVTSGTSIVSWNDSYGDRQWSDGNSSTLNDLPLDTYYNDGSLTFQGDAPITIAPTFGTCPGTTIAVPIKVVDFNTIGVLSLTLQFSASVLTYQSFVNTSGFPGLGVLNPNIGNITIAGFVPTSSPGITLADSATLVTLYFTYLGGSTGLTWFDNGESCEYGGPPISYPILNDIPASTYYIPGQIDEFCASYWTGNVDTDWFDAGNWTNGIPSAVKDAIVPVVNPNPYPSIDGVSTCRDADIALGASITIQTIGTLTAVGNFNNNGILIIESSATGDGSFIDNGTITGTGVAKVDRYLVSQKWHYVSPPISDGVSDIYYDIYLKEFTEATGTWFYLVPVDIPLNPMQGYASWASDAYTATTTVSYIGNLNTGVQSITGLTNTPGAPNRGYNLVGNPYPSAIDWDLTSGWTKTNLDNAIYFWNPLVGQYGGYVSYPPTGTNGATNIIPSGQGYFVHVNDASPTGSLTVNNNARLHDNKDFMKSTEAFFEHTSLRLKTFSELNPYTDETVIQFINNATPAFDPEFDAYKMSGLDEAPQLYSITPDPVNLTVNTNPELITNTSIPMGFEAGVDGIYTLAMTDMLNFSEKTNIILEDKLQNISIDLKEQNSYGFFADITDDPNRFTLHFQVNSSSSNEFTENDNLQIFASGDYIYLTKSNNNPINGEIRIFDILGRTLVSEKISDVHQHKLFVDFKGVLIVTFNDITEGKFYRKKIQIY